MARLSKSEINKKLQKGQALLIVLLGMAVVLTMVLSVVSRSVTDIQLTTRDDEALRAFSAAEAGVEQALIVGTNIGQTELTDSGSFYSVDVERLAEGKFQYSYPEDLYSGESGTLWFVSHNSDGSLTCTLSGVTNPCFTGTSFNVCWGADNTASNNAGTPAVEVSVYYDKNALVNNNPLGLSPNYGDVQVARFTFDPYTSRPDGNNFAAPTAKDCEVEGKMLEFRGTVNIGSVLPVACVSGSNTVAGCMLFAKAKLIYNSTPHPVGFTAGKEFPGQGVHIESTGQFGDSTRQIDVFRTYSEPLSVFESAVFSMGSSGDLTK